MKILAVLFLLSMYSCNSASTIEKKGNTKDSVLNGYLSMIDTLPYYDTNTIDYRLLRAYSKNDTSELKNLQRHFESNSSKKVNPHFDSCIQIQEFAQLNADEAYQFEYGGFYCSYITITTITKLNDSIYVSSIVYQYASDTTPCKIIESKKTLLDSISWEKFQISINRSDLWGLKSDNGHHGVDGRTLTIYGYQKEEHWHPRRRIKISRWSPEGHALIDCYLMLLKFCNIKSGCLYPG